MVDRARRGQLERVIITQGDIIAVSHRDFAWLRDPLLEDYLDAWQELSRYYRAHGDDHDINLLVMREYAHLTRVCRLIKLENGADQESCDRAREVTEYLEDVLEMIIRQIVASEL